MPTPVEIRHFHAFGAIGGGAKGFNKGHARVGSLEARFRCIGSVDVDVAANRDFKRIVGVDATLLDMFDRSQYRDFHGEDPPADWKEATPQDIQRAAGGERPHIVFLSAPCKGFSGLLSETRSRTAKYQALNRLTLRGMFLMLEAWKNDPPELFVFENVPRIATRGRSLLDQIIALLRSYGYATAETTHDCGELGGLAQSRKRFLLVARHMEKVPPFLYVPEKQALRAVGDVLGRMPMPGDSRGGPMHRMPQLQWKTWVRLAFVEAGSDWRSLNKLSVEEGALRDFLIVPDMRNCSYGVRKWDEPMGVVQSESRPSNGSFSVADPRFESSAQWNNGQQYGVHDWRETAGAVSGQQYPAQGRFSVADPRLPANEFHGFRVVAWERSTGTVTGARAPGSSAQAVADPRHAGDPKFNNEYRVAPWSEPTAAVTGAGGKGQCVADPRPGSDAFGKYGVTDWADPTGTVISGSTTGQGAFAVADPRSGLDRKTGDAYLTGGHYGVIPWAATSGAVSSAASYDSGRWSVADPRDPLTGDRPMASMPLPAQKLVAHIRAIDGTCHRPFTTLELGALQSLIEPEEWFELDGLSDSAWRERIGNAVPPKAAQAIASVMAQTLLLAWSGETFMLSAQPIWVRPIAVGLSLTSIGEAS